jgi:streptogramin lyase
MTAGAGYLWVDIYHHGLQLRPFDPRTTTFGRPVVSTSFAVIMGQLGRPAYGLGSVWVSDGSSLLWKIDPTTMRATVLLATPSAPGLPLYSAGGPAGVTTAAGSVWVGFGNATEIARVNPATGALEQQLFITHTNGTILQATTSQIWVLFQTGSSSGYLYLPDPSQPGRVGRIDPQTGAFTGQDLKIGSSGGYDSFAASPATAWVGDLYNSTVTAIGKAASASDRRARTR